MQPNDLPLVCLPLGLSDQDAATLIEFLYTLTEALERHYAGQLLRHARSHDAPSAGPDPPDRRLGDPPF